jgi:hypothetical protein
MGVEKMSVSFDLELGEAIRLSASEHQMSVSAWLAQAAGAQLRNHALGTAVVAWERKHGKLSEEEVNAAAKVLDRAARAKPRQRGVA